MNESKLSVLLVDDHPVVREGLALAIQAQTDMVVVGEASTGEEAISLAESLAPAVIIIDLQMPGIGGLAAIDKIKDAAPDTRIIVFTTYGGEADVIPAIEAGADGYLLKGSTAGDILQAIRSVARGDSPIDPTAAKVLLGKVSRSSAPDASGLSGRELEVLELMGQGLRNRDIAERLFISEKTVKAHVGSIFTKLNVLDRTSAVTTAIRRGLIKL